eukprot:3940981-Rhodomonas_salina.2
MDNSTTSYHAALSYALAMRCPVLMQAMASPGIRLRACYAISGTDLACCPADYVVELSSEVPTYSHPTPSPPAIVLCDVRYCDNVWCDRALRCPVLRYCMVLPGLPAFQQGTYPPPSILLRICYAMSGADVEHAGFTCALSVTSVEYDATVLVAPMRCSVLTWSMLLPAHCYASLLPQDYEQPARWYPGQSTALRYAASGYDVACCAKPCAVSGTELSVLPLCRVLLGHVRVWCCRSIRCYCVSRTDLACCCTRESEMPSYMQALQYGLIGFLPLAIVLGVSSYALATPCSVLIRQEQYSARCAVVLRQPNPVPGIRSSLCVLVLRSGMMIAYTVYVQTRIDKSLNRLRGDWQRAEMIYEGPLTDHRYA